MNSIIKQYYNQRDDYGVNSLRRKKINNLASQKINQGNLKILDLGCAGGYLSQAWKIKNNFILGIDIAEKSIQQAEKTLDQVYLADLENYDWLNKIQEKKFDIILCAEILEHLFDPQKFLIKLKDILQPDGCIILTTPNFLVWNNRLRIFLGHYGHKEVFNDLSHIHLFSYNSLKKLLAKLNFQVVEEDNLWYPNYLEKLPKLLPANLFVYQIILKVKLKK